MTDFVFTLCNGRVSGHIDYTCDPRSQSGLAREVYRIELSEDEATLPIEKLMKRFEGRV